MVNHPISVSRIADVSVKGISIVHSICLSGELLALATRSVFSLERRFDASFQDDGRGLKSADVRGMLNDKGKARAKIVLSNLQGLRPSEFQNESVHNDSVQIEKIWHATVT